MELIGKEGFTFTEGGVCAAKGFLANGLNCGLNSDQNKNDLCLIMSESECSAAAVYTQNKVMRMEKKRQRKCVSWQQGSWASKQKKSLWHPPA